MQPLAQHFIADVVDHIGHESLCEHASGLVARYAAALHVEQCLLVELACGGAMACLYLVAVDLKLRRCVHTGIGRREYVAVGLGGIGVHRRLLHDHTSAE